LNEQRLSPLKAFYLATLGAAQALRMESRIGNIGKGKEADFLLLDPARTAITERRWRHSNDIAARLFALTMLGRYEVVAHTWLKGCRQRREPAPGSEELAR
jgi:guanine deaminase